MNVSGINIEFSGYRWGVKAARAMIAPGPNYFSASQESVWGDDEGLHLTLRPDQGRWYCSEVICKERLGYGTYIFYLKGFIDRLPSTAVLGLFTWDVQEGNFHREFDIEFSRWGIPLRDVGQFTVQPHDVAGHKFLFDFSLVDDRTTHIIRWTPEEVTFESYYGWVTEAGAPENSLIAEWTYKEEIWEPSRERVRLNLWLYKGISPSVEVVSEIILTDFQFYPL